MICEICGCDSETELKATKEEMQAIANMLIDLYTDISETESPEVYGTILGIHERIEVFLQETK